MNAPQTAITSPEFSTAHALENGGRHRVLRSEQWVPADLARTFAFFADATNLEALTPPFLEFAILTPRPITMGLGTRIEYRLRLNGLPLRWVSRIDDWEPGRGFTDVQIHGPYARWVHRHAFEERRGGTLVSDRVVYALPLSPLTDPLHAWFVRPSLARIFAYRREVIARLFG